MKKLIFLLALATAFVACEKNEPKAFKINATDMIAIKPASKSTAMKMKADAPTHLSALDIVRKTTEISIKMSGGIYGGRSFASAQRDTVSQTPKLLMWATDVISLEGLLQDDFIAASDVVFVNYNLDTPKLRDTIAYIPNSVLRNAETAIRAAYEAKDIEACYALFNDAYTFVPITGAEWRALKGGGQN